MTCALCTVEAGSLQEPIAWRCSMSFVLGYLDGFVKKSKADVVKDMCAAHRLRTEAVMVEVGKELGKRT